MMLFMPDTCIIQTKTKHFDSKLLPGENDIINTDEWQDELLKWSMCW